MARQLHYSFILSITAVALLAFTTCQSSQNPEPRASIDFDLIHKFELTPTKSGKKKTNEERNLFSWARVLHEHYMQINPNTGMVSLEEKMAERKASLLVPVRPEGAKSTNASLANFAFRGPSNFGGRTRGLAYDISDVSGNTILAGGVSGGVFRTTNGGTSWTKVSPNDEIHNVTCLVQDPRPGFQNIWYYGTGESIGNSASLAGATFLGQGIWQSTDGGLTWTQMPGTASNQGNFDSRFDFVHSLAVHPITGHLYAGISGRLTYYDGSNWNTTPLNAATNSTRLVDVKITSTGRAYAGLSGNFGADRGVWTSPDGVNSWTQIGDNGSPFSIRTTSGRVVLDIAPSNENIVYVLYYNDGSTASPGEADLFRWNQATTTWTDFSNKIPDEAGGNSPGNDPFAIQTGYDIVVSVKPDNENYVLIGGTNVYRCTNINTQNFTRIGGYRNNGGYALYDLGGGAVHHPDIHALVFNPFNPNQMLSGTDGGVHLSQNINASPHPWTNLNNDYRTYQYYHVAIDPQAGSDIVIGGAQDNGTTGGGIDLGAPDATTMTDLFSGDGAAVAISRADPCTPFYFSTQNGSMVRDCPAGAFIDPNGASSDFVTYFWLDPDNNTNLYYAGQNDLYRTNDAVNVTSNTWTNVGGLPTTDYIKSMTTTWGAYTTSHDLFIGGDEGAIYRLSNPANATNMGGIVNITPPTASTAFPTVVSGLSVHPTNPDELLAVYSNYGVNNIFLTTNANAGSPTWVNVERNLTDFSIRSCAIVEAGGSTLYVVGTARGLYTSPDPTTTDWTRVAAPTLGFALISRLVYRPSDNKLLIGTHGNGVWIADVIPPVLPVELSKFEAYAVEDGVQLDWTTESEENNKGFEVQRSWNGVSFEGIGFVDGKGNSSVVNHYDFTDPVLREKVQYYRLRQVDFDGTVVYSEIKAVRTGLADDLGSFSFETYPNPVIDEITLELSRNPKKEINIEIYNMKGERLHQFLDQSLSRKLRISLKDIEMAEGIYILSIRQDGLLIGSKKFYKQ
jgi:hypothetical protein